MPSLSALTAISAGSTSLAALSGITTTAGNLNNIILVSPNTILGYQPQNGSGSSILGSILQIPPGFVFHYEGEQTVSVESDITDHFIEDNTAIQDQIALRPEIITTHGYIGELNDVPPSGLALLQSAAQTLTTVSAYTPGLSISAEIAYAQAFQLYQVAANAANAAIAAWSALSGTPYQNKQQSAFQQFYGYWTSRTLFTVQTPWAVFENCALYKMRTIQDAETEMISDFELTFKVIRMASTLTSAPLTSGRLSSQSSGVTNNGTSTPASSVSVPNALGGVR